MAIRHALLAMFIASAFATAVPAQVVGYNFRTGDAWVDTELGVFSDYGRRDRGYFVDDLVGSYGVPRYLVDELLDKRRWDPGDVYYASALAYQARRPLSDVIRAYDSSDGKGKGWGVVAMSMGIKPGSAEFHALKGQMAKSKGKYSARGAGGPPAGKGKAKAREVEVDDGPGNSGKAKGNGQGQGKGKSKGKPD